MTALAEGELAKAAPPRFAESILPKIVFTSSPNRVLEYKKNYRPNSLMDFGYSLKEAVPS